MIKEFKYPFDQLNITSSDIEELLGFEQEIPEPFPELIKESLSEVPAHSGIKGTIKTYDSIKINHETGTLKIENQILQPAKIVLLQIKHATGIAVFACTAGHEISARSKSFAENGDQLMSYILDVIGSVMVEKGIAKIVDEIEFIQKKAGLNISDSFTPGYCEWNVNEQQKLFKLLPYGCCGIKLSDSSLMNPIKSASGIIGIGTKLKKKGYQCSWCNDHSCIYGKRNRKKLNKKVG